MNFVNFDRILDPLLKSKRERAEQTIRSQVVWALGAGLVPVPLLDVAAVTAVQVSLVRQLCTIYDKPYDESKGRAIVSALISSVSASIGASVFKAIPVVGTFLGGASMAVLSGATTYAVGQVFCRHFERGGTLDSFDLPTAQALFEEEYERGKAYAQKLYNEQRGKAAEPEAQPTAATPAANEDPFVKLEKLAALRDKGIVTEEEYLRKKQELLSQL